LSRKDGDGEAVVSLRTSGRSSTRYAARTVSEHTDEDGATIVQHSRTDLVGFASKKLSAPYRPDGHATG
jgi:hypothetical protein